MTISAPDGQRIESPSSSKAYSAYLYGIIGLGIAAIASSAFQLLTSSIGYQWLILASLTVFASMQSIKIPATNSKISIGDTLFFTNLILFGTPAGVITAAFEGITGSIRARTRNRRIQYSLFNMATMAGSAYIAGSVFFRLMRSGPLFREPDIQFSNMLIPLGALAFTHYFANSGSVAIIVALEKRKNAYLIWKDSFLWHGRYDHAAKQCFSTGTCGIGNHR